MKTLECIKACWHSNDEIDDNLYLDRFGNETADDAEWVEEGTRIEVPSLDIEDESNYWCTDIRGEVAVYFKEYWKEVK